MASLESSSNRCALCGRAVVETQSNARLCQCGFNEPGETLSSSRDPIWADDFSGTNESGVRTSRRNCFQNVFDDVRNRTAAVYRWVASNFLTGRDCTEKYTNRSFMCGSILLIFGTYMFMFPEEDLRYRQWAWVMIGIGGIFVWVPVICWMSESREGDSNGQQDPGVRSHRVDMMDAPPSYDTLPGVPPQLPKEGPPPYDQVFPNADTTGVQPHCSGTAARVPMCSIHLPSASPMFRESSLQRTAVDGPALHRSRSLGDLS